MYFLTFMSTSGLLQTPITDGAVLLYFLDAENALYIDQNVLPSVGNKQPADAGEAQLIEGFVGNRQNDALDIVDVLNAQQPDAVEPLALRRVGNGVADKGGNAVGAQVIVDVLDLGIAKIVAVLFRCNVWNSMWKSVPAGSNDRPAL